MRLQKVVRGARFAERVIWPVWGSRIIAGPLLGTAPKLGGRLAWSQATIFPSGITPIETGTTGYCWSGPHAPSTAGSASADCGAQKAPAAITPITKSRAVTRTPPDVRVVDSIWSPPCPTNVI